MLIRVLDRPYREASIVGEVVASGDEEVTVVGAELESRAGRR
jgi:hypothetical protein